MDETAAPSGGGAISEAVVLVVDDEYLGRVHLVDELTEYGFTVVEAPSGDDALLVMRARRVDLVVTDRRMPGRLDGDALARVVAELFPDVPVLMMSAERPAPADRATVVEFFAKPVDVAAVRRLIVDLLFPAGGPGAAAGRGQDGWWGRSG